MKKIQKREGEKECEVRVDLKRRVGVRLSKEEILTLA